MKITSAVDSIFIKKSITDEEYEEWFGSPDSYETAGVSDVDRLKDQGFEDVSHHSDWLGDGGYEDYGPGYRKTDREGYTHYLSPMSWHHPGSRVWARTRVDPEGQEEGIGPEFHAYIGDAIQAVHEARPVNGFLG